MAKKAGAATITISASDRSVIQTTVKITVRQRATSLTINDPIDALYAGEKQQINSIVLPEDTSDKRLAYESENSDIASISETGLITAHKAGKTKISVKTIDGSDIKKSFTLTVKQYVSSLSADPKELIIITGERADLNISILPEDATDKSLRYVSNDENIITVNGSGEITAIKAGTAEITITAADRMTVSKLIKITVKQRAKSLSIDNAPSELYLGDQFKLNYRVLPEDTSDKSITFLSDNSDIASVDSQGLITPKEKGKVTISIKTNDGSGIRKDFTVEIKQNVESVNDRHP